MKKINLFILVFPLITMTLSAISPRELRRHIDQSYGTLKTWQAEVTQTNYFRQLERTITYRGKIYYGSARLLIDFDRPHRQRLSIVDSRVQLFDSQTNTLFKTNVLPEFGRMNPVDILRHYWDASEVSVTRYDSKTAHVLLIPKNDPLITQLTARIRRADWIVEQLSYRDISGNTVTYEFANIRINAPIPTTIWEFRLPPDVQVIEQ